MISETKHRAAMAGVEAFTRYELAKTLRTAAHDLERIGQQDNADTLRRMAKNLDVQRRRIMRGKK